MSLQQDIRPVTYFKNRAADLLEQVNKTQRPVIITQNGKPRGVLQDPETYARMRRALGMLKLLAQGEDDVRAGRTLGQDRVFSSLKKQLKTRARRYEPTEKT